MISRVRQCQSYLLWEPCAEALALFMVFAVVQWQHRVQDSWQLERLLYSAVISWLLLSVELRPALLVDHRHVPQSALQSWSCAICRSCGIMWCLSAGQHARISIPWKPACRCGSLASSWDVSGVPHYRCCICLPWGNSSKEVTAKPG